MQPVNPRFERELTTNARMRIGSKSVVLTNTENDFVEVVLYHWPEALTGDKYLLYRNSYHDEHPHSEHSTLGTSSTYIGEWFAINKDDAEQAFDKASQGYVRCNYCGKWVKYEDSKRFVPAGCSCTNEECMKLAKAQEDDFFSMPLD